MWTDIGMIYMNVLSFFVLTTRNSDYMDRRRVFTLDPAYFPLNRVREIVNYLHSHKQRYSMSSSLTARLLDFQLNVIHFSSHDRSCGRLSAWRHVWYIQPRNCRRHLAEITQWERNFGACMAW